MRSVYLAARYSRHPEMRQVRDELVSRGYLVTSRWIDQHDGALPDSLDSAALNGEPARAGLFAQVDVDDLAAVEQHDSFTAFLAALGGASPGVAA